jgi:hypothetical protein
LARDALAAHLSETWSPPVDLIVLVASADAAVNEAAAAAGSAAEVELWAAAAEAAEAARVAIAEHPVPPGPLIAAAGDLARSSRAVIERIELDRAFGEITGSEDPPLT